VLTTLQSAYHVAAISVEVEFAFFLDVFPYYSNVTISIVSKTSDARDRFQKSWKRMDFM